MLDNKIKENIFLPMNNLSMSDTAGDNFQLIADSIPQLVWTADSTGKPDYFNQKWYEYTGLSKEVIYSEEGWLKAIHPEDIPLVKKRWQIAKIDQQVYESEFRLKRASDNTYRWHLDRAIPIKNKSGNLIKWFGTVTDIEDQKTNIDKILRYAAIVENSDDAIIGKKLDGTITSWNKGATKLYGYNEEETLGKSITIIFPEDKLDEFSEIMEVLKMGESIDHYQTQRRKKNGQIVEVAITISPIKDNFGNVVGASTITRDIGEFIELERRKNAFIGMASHELKTPLTTMKALSQISQILVKAKDYKNLESYLQRIEDQTNRLVELVNDLLDLSRIEAGKLELNKTEFNFQNLVDETIENIRHLSPTRKILVAGKVIDKIKADKNRIEQVLINLIVNALKYSPPTTDVKISITSQKNKITFSITDYGIGIDKENQERIFDRFYRAKDIDAQTYPGLGIGLYISSEIIRRHGGKISVSSQKNEGSTFTFTLPLK